MPLNLEASIGLDSSGFERGIERVHEQVKDTIKAFALGAIGVGTVEEAFRRTIETADELVDSAKKLDMTVEQVQLLREAAKESGVEFEALAKSISKIDEARAMALGGGSEGREAMAAFQALGVSKQDLLTKTATDLFTGQISSAVKTNNIETITEPLKEVLGKGAEDAVGALKTNFGDLQAEMMKTGAIMDGQVAEKLHDLSDQFSMVSNVITAELAPALLQLVQWISTLILKGGGSISKASAVAGSLVGQAGFIGAAKDIAASAAQEFKNLISGKGFALTKEQNEAIDKKFGINSDDVQKAANAASEPWADALKRILQPVASSRPKPDFTKTMIDAQRANGGRRTESDALVKVGNFLGSNMAGVRSAAAAYQTAANTKRSADTLDRMVRLMSEGMGPVRSNPKTSASPFSSNQGEWPIF